MCWWGRRVEFAVRCFSASLGNGAAARLMLLSEIVSGSMPPDDRVDPAEYFVPLRETVARRNGCKLILARGTPHEALRCAESGAVE